MIDWHPLDQDEPPRPLPHDNSDVTNEDLLAMLGGTLMPQDIKDRRERAKNKALRRRRMRNLESYLAEFDTRTLLEFLRRGAGGREVYIPGLDTMSLSPHIEVVLRKTLAGREHIPNKPEATAIRRLAASRNRGQSKRKDR